jgi:hypothetical protein
MVIFSSYHAPVYLDRVCGQSQSFVKKGNIAENVRRLVNEEVIDYLLDKHYIAKNGFRQVRRLKTSKRNYSFSLGPEFPGSTTSAAMLILRRHQKNSVYNICCLLMDQYNSSTRRR